MKLDRRNTSIVRLLTIATVGLALGLAVFIGLSAAVPAHAQEGPAECERRFSGQQVISTDAGVVFAVDLDGDGDIDVLSAAYYGVAWFENTDGLGTFGPQQMIGTTVRTDLSVFAADLDCDGDADVLLASYLDDTIAWYENTDGLGTFGPRQVITTDADGPRSVFAADLDGDGDTDVLFASGWDDKIAWFENTDGMGTFGPQQVITLRASSAESVFAADLDGDGDTDVLSASSWDDKIAWYENTDGLGTFGPQQVITTAANHAHSVLAADFDGDGDTDVLSASSGGHKIAWYENTDGMGTFGPQQVLNGGTEFGNSVFAADLDGDGDTDVLAASYRDDKFVWYENTNGKGTFGPQKVISGDADRAFSVFAADLDGDGDTDVLLGARGKISWYENEIDCNGNGVNDGCDLAEGTSLDCNYNGRPDECDLGDGTSSDCNMNGMPDECELDCNSNGQPDECDLANRTSADCNRNQIPDDCDVEPEFPPRGITSAVDNAWSVFTADMDSDGDIDVLSASASDDKIAWYENTDGLGSFGPQQVITNASQVPLSVFAADLDGDGDIDVLSASHLDDKIAWYPNADGLGTFGPQQVITTKTDSARCVFATDLDGDGDTDVLSASFEDGKIAWYENIDGLGSFGPQQVITAADYASSVVATDLDGDGDADVLPSHSGPIAWYENADGLGTFVRRQVITNGGGLFAADFDGDGDSDIFSSSRMAWFENTDGLGTFGPQRDIATTAYGADSVFADDLDGDGDTDVLLGFRADPETHSGEMIIWYENTDGLGTFGPQQVIAQAPHGGRSLFAADLDNDGDTDVLSASFHFIAWYENVSVSRDCNDNDSPDECDIADGISGDCDGSDVPDECEPFGIEDVDGDGVVELCDLCPESQLGRTLILNGCDTNVPEMVFDDGCTMADLLDECNGDQRNHGGYVSCVTYVAREWKHDGAITGREFGRIVSCAAKPRTISRRAIRKVDDGHK